MVKNKLHIIGCSFSTHRFFDLAPGDYPNDPSNYARIVAKNLDLEPVAYAREGQGNPFILKTLSENVDKYQPSDTVLIQLTHPDRLFNTIEHFGDLKIHELLDPPQHLLDLTNLSAKDFKTAGFIYTEIFKDFLHTHKLYCDSIISTCLTLPCNSIILPFYNKKEYQEKFIDYTKIKFGSNPWTYMDQHHDNTRFDHLTDELHNRIAFEILKDIK